MRDVGLAERDAAGRDDRDAARDEMRRRDVVADEDRERARIAIAEHLHAVRRTGDLLDRAARAVPRREHEARRDQRARAEAALADAHGDDRGIAIVIRARP